MEHRRCAWVECASWDVARRFAAVVTEGGETAVLCGEFAAGGAASDTARLYLVYVDGAFVDTSHSADGARTVLDAARGGAGGDTNAPVRGGQGTVPSGMAGSLIAFMRGRGWGLARLAAWLECSLPALAHLAAQARPATSTGEALLAAYAGVSGERLRHLLQATGVAAPSAGALPA